MAWAHPCSTCLRHGTCHVSKCMLEHYLLVLAAYTLEACLCLLPASLTGLKLASLRPERFGMGKSTVSTPVHAFSSSVQLAGSCLTGCITCNLKTIWCVYCKLLQPPNEGYCFPRWVCTMHHLHVKTATQPTNRLAALQSRQPCNAPDLIPSMRVQSSLSLSAR